MNVLELRHVSRRFGSRPVLKDLTLQVPEHTVYGFIGENGAGKTTTMKLILGLLALDGGEIFVCGERVRYGQTQTNRFVGYLPDVPEFYGYLTPSEYLKLCGGIANVPSDRLRKRSGELLDLVGLDKASGVRISGFSRGMKQRLGIAQALIHQSKLLICDEPTSALDPVGRKEIIDILHAIRQETTVLFSTHILPDIERVCDEVGLLHGGVMALQGRLDEIRRLHADSGFTVEFQEERDAARFSAVLPGENIISTRLLYSKGTREDMMRAIALLSKLDLCPMKVELCEPSLEALFLEAAKS